MLLRSHLPFAGPVVVSLLFTPALAVEFCVSCTGPEQTYICAIDAGNGARNAAALQLYCVVNAAKDRGHQSCKVSKDVTAGCNGPRLEYVYAGTPLPAPLSLNPHPQSGNGAAPGEADGHLPAPRKNGQAETLVDLTNKAVQSSKQRIRKAGETVDETAGKARGSIKNVASKTKNRVGKALKNAGKAVSKAARTTFHCVRTLFGECW